jgi:hypothetical protein
MVGLSIMEPSVKNVKRNVGEMRSFTSRLRYITILQSFTLYFIKLFIHGQQYYYEINALSAVLTNIKIFSDVRPCRKVNRYRPSG